MIEPFWKTFWEVCDDKNIGPELIIRAKLYTEHRQASSRAVVVREMAKRGVAIKQIRIVTGEDFSESAIRKILENVI